MKIVGALLRKYESHPGDLKPEVLRAVEEGLAVDAHSLQALQVAVFVMVGGGTLGLEAADRPSSFYIDARVGRRPYARGRIKLAVKLLARLAVLGGWNDGPPPMPCRTLLDLLLHGRKGVR